MRGFRFSIGKLLIVVVVLAVGLAALRESNDLADSSVFSLTIAILLFSALVAARRAGRRRAYWLGFAMVGWTYLVASLVPSVESRLITTKGLAYLGARLSRATPARIAVLDFDRDGWMDLLVPGGGAPNTVFVDNGDGTFRDLGVVVNPTSLTAPVAENPGGYLGVSLRGDPEHFVRIGHSLLALLLATVGGVLACHLGRADEVEERDGGR